MPIKEEIIFIPLAVFAFGDKERWGRDEGGERKRRGKKKEKGKRKKEKGRRKEKIIITRLDT
jgi:hypothetical protein